MKKNTFTSCIFFPRNSDILIQLRLGMSALGIERGVDRRGRHRGRSQGQNKAGAARHKLKSEHSKSPPKSHSQTYRSSKNNSQERKEARLRLEQLEEVRQIEPGLCQNSWRR